MENSKTNEQHNFFLNLSQKLDLRSSKHAAYSKKNIRKHKNNKYKIITPTWSDELQLPDNSYYVSDIYGYIEHIIKKHKTLTMVTSMELIKD